MTWPGWELMRRINYMLKVNFDVSELVQNTTRLLKHIQSKVDEIDQQAPHLGVREYFRKLGGIQRNPIYPTGRCLGAKSEHIFDKFDEEQDDTV